jgi:hypothetical protein
LNNKKNNKLSTIVLWAPYILINSISVFHVWEFFQLSLNTWESGILAAGWELSQIASLWLIKKGQGGWFAFVFLWLFAQMCNIWFFWKGLGTQWHSWAQLFYLDPDIDTKRILSLLAGGSIGFASLQYMINWWKLNKKTDLSIDIVTNNKKNNENNENNTMPNEIIENNTENNFSEVNTGNSVSEVPVTEVPVTEVPANNLVAENNFSEIVAQENQISHNNSRNDIVDPGLQENVLQENVLQENIINVSKNTKNEKIKKSKVSKGKLENWKK